MKNVYLYYLAIFPLWYFSFTLVDLNIHLVITFFSLKYFL